MKKDVYYNQPQNRRPFGGSHLLPLHKKTLFSTFFPSGQMNIGLPLAQLAVHLPALPVFLQSNEMLGCTSSVLRILAHLKPALGLPPTTNLSSEANEAVVVAADLKDPVGIAADPVGVAADLKDPIIVPRAPWASLRTPRTPRPSPRSP